MEKGNIVSLPNGNKMLVFSEIRAGSDDYNSDYLVGYCMVTDSVVTEIDYRCNRVRNIDEFTEQELIAYARIIPAFNVITNRTLAITAKARSGKDHMANFLWTGYGVALRVLAFAEPIYKMANILLGNRPGKNRETLIMIGQGLRREDPHVWVKRWLQTAIEAVLEDPKVNYFICQDLRQPNEFSFFKHLGATIVRVEADEDARLDMIKTTDGKAALNSALLNDETESHADTFEVDYIIKNDYVKNHYESAISQFAREVLVAKKGW